MSAPGPNGGTATADGAVEVAAPGKVNLGLRVAARRGDGFHEIDTVFARLDHGDRLRVRLEPAAGVHGIVHDERGGPPSDAALPPMTADNLAWRAADAWLRASGATIGVHVELWKRLPVAAGLGGGSSDAGAVLRALAQLLPSSGTEVETVAAELGSDVPFFASGRASARGRGRGERLRPFDLPARWLVLVNPGTPVAVADAYRALVGFGPPVDWDAVEAAWRQGAAPRWRNDLQHGVFGFAPEVRTAWSSLREAGLAAPLLSGSGASCFALADDEAHARRCAGEIAAARPDWWVRAAQAPV